MKVRHIQECCQGNKTIMFFVKIRENGFQQQLEKTLLLSLQGAGLSY